MKSKNKQNQFKKLLFVPIALVFCLLSASCGVSNPTVEAGEVGMVTNEPILFGEKGEILDIVVGPSSYGVGWRNAIKPKNKESFQPKTKKINYSKTGNDDRRILSKDKINMEVSVSVVLALRNSPSLAEYDLKLFKQHAKEYFTRYTNAWDDRYREPFSSYVRTTLGALNYADLKEQRVQQAQLLQAELDRMLSGSPLVAIKTVITNVNPPARMIEEQEKKKAVDIAMTRQVDEQNLQEAKKKVMETEAMNLAAALKQSPKYLEYKRLMLEQQRVEMLSIAMTGDNASTISKMLVPYGVGTSVNMQ